MLARFFDTIAPRSRSEARFRRDLVFFFLGILITFLLRQALGIAILDGYQREASIVEQNLKNAADTLQRLYQPQ